MQSQPRPEPFHDEALAHKPCKSSAEQVAEHYNTRRELGMVERLRTRITGLRVFNNWVKSLLINSHAFPGCKVLDLGCGKGGDLRKWGYAQIGEYVGMDIAQVSVEQAEARYNEMGMLTRFPARFYAQDCYGEPLEKTLRPVDYQANLISTQFCLHYAFESEKKARQTMLNISSHLAPGGAFICTIPNANWLVKRMREEKSKSYGNSVYRVEFSKYSNSDERISRYGVAYAFTLDEAVEDCTEYLVHMPSFIQLAQEYGLELLYCKPFHELYQQSICNQKALELFQRMRVVDESRPEISADEWEAVGIYLAIAFTKRQ
ncbi:mRNA cap guanine-N7 methyltransferase [Coemansia sp. RSA 1358]|nr:guanine-N(7)-methyltransferase domain-containing protein [Coemansia spiralis]KAJ1988295.1 mRNA cap guanine-N7 methyltransferase [Coemansia umbellata]KAJ2619892.1 mRNA cap guanine-N7 methyltransferase [Coemansia sp. RSA 1358]